MVKYKTNDIIKNVNEYVNLINSARVQKNFLETSGRNEKRRIAAAGAAAIRL
ncbi:MAG: hypothetical protein IKB65_01970 [Ruminiclostridium sp.]|nr:hypothetical protein [Ruminiclostridium sp.]MBR2490230.1 hypothetical protein [Ruminiclostridium sp.]